MRLRATPENYDKFLSVASVFWRNNLPAADGEDWIIVEALHHQARNVLRNLVLANALRRVQPARVLVLTGTDQSWYDTIWEDFNVEKVRRLCEAFAVTEVLDVHELVDRFMAASDEEPATIEVCGQPLTAGADVPEGDGPRSVRWSSVDPEVVDDSAYASACRLDLLPRLEGDREQNARLQAQRPRSAAFAAVYETLIRALKPIAFVTSHVDYDPWGLGVDAATRFDVPVVHVQSTGSLKAYTLFPEHRTGEATFRAELTRQIGDYFDQHVWGNRDIVRSAAELVAWRTRGNLGRPSWWRFGPNALCELTNPTERAQFRAYGMARLGLDPELPVITVFNHAVSDALGTNREIFPDLAAWFEETAAFAASQPQANWLFLDHPNQDKYDATGFFDKLAASYANAPHLTFMPSNDLSKNAMWSLTDLGVTVRGSVSNELPAFGTPVIQAGWSEWSACGVSTVAEDTGAYWKTLTASIEALTRKEPLITAEQVERARLWSWFYRSAADVSSLLVPHWDVMPEEMHLRTLEINMRAVESDADPVFTSVRRMWTRREPFLTRFDLTNPETLKELLPVMRNDGARDDD
ncbi:hypothetical protein J4573_34190 [Actinomadura barringtoniae]|uniref:Uncharacterized protein n=1 Tax=Actinomadura barringtoniae TaxID=1427535 RepID=A0A939TA77_9ACTN|nr:hypothetical protein [Actinomadura barringtoniae]MBO2452182.1 hypothetical protein [Actinomadura barringtoniae]